MKEEIIKLLRKNGAKLEAFKHPATKPTTSAT